MAARRLVIVMVVMLGISSLAALLAPTAERNETTDTTTTTTGPERVDKPTSVSGRLVHATIDASRGPRTIHIRAGDQLALVVRHRHPDGVEIPRLGELEDVDPLSPARFDLLPPPGRYPIRLAETGNVIGEIVIRSSGSPRRG